jgi:hypothetical protein
MANTPRYPATTVQFEAVPLLGTEWQVVVTYPTGLKEQIGRFENEADAVAWIGSPQCFAWVRLRGYE